MGGQLLCASGSASLPTKRDRCGKLSPTVSLLALNVDMMLGAQAAALKPWSAAKRTGDAS